MRFLILILSIVILLQPASWAMSPAHQKFGEGMRVDHVSTQSIVVIATDAGKQCQANRDGRVLSGGLNHNGHLIQDNNLPESCHSAPSAVSLLEAATITFSFQYLDLAYHAPSISFQSRTESPEIRPPHNNIRL
jgi:hypothetical protein